MYKIFGPERMKKKNLAKYKDPLLLKETRISENMYIFKAKQVENPGLCVQLKHFGQWPCITLHGQNTLTPSLQDRLASHFPRQTLGKTGLKCQGEGGKDRWRRRWLLLSSNYNPSLPAWAPLSKRLQTCVEEGHKTDFFFFSTGLFLLSVGCGKHRRRARN